jgi:catechol 2,3-dioxygenase-like lactoylglutathione lyase family enzyme
MTAKLEHVNFTAADPKAMADVLCRLFGWRIRWSGGAIYGGHTVHVGGDDDYVAIYSGDPSAALAEAGTSYSTRKGLNHLGIVVEDIAATEARVKAEGFEPRSHASYEPGRRFYFDGPEDLEIEVVSYD